MKYAVALLGCLLGTAPQATTLRVTALAPAPGSALTAPPDSLVITLNAAPDPVTVGRTSVVLTRAGADATPGTADDVVVRPVSVTVAGSQITVDLSGLFLPNDRYRLRVRGNEVSFPGTANWWKLDDASGTTALDSAGSLNGTLGGVATPTWSTAGRVGGALQFAGSDGRALLSGTDLPVPWTAAMWVNRTDSPVGDARLMNSGTSSLRLEQFNHTNQTGVTVYGSVDTPFGFAAPLGQWAHLTFRSEPGGTSLFVDGGLSQTVGTSLGCPRGSFGSGSYNSMSGLVDEVRIFNRRLSDAEVRTEAALGGAVRGRSGLPLDGEFSGAFPSGNGGPGGDFVGTLTVSAGIPPPGGGSPAVTDLTAGGCGLLGMELLVPLGVLLMAERRRFVGKGLAWLAAFVLGSAGALGAQEEKSKPEPSQEAPKAPQEEPKPKLQDPQANPEPTPETLEPPPDVEWDRFLAAARAGLWFHSEFEAVTPLGVRRIKRESLGEAGIDLGYRLERWAFWVSFDYAQAEDVTVWTGGLHVGHFEPLPLGDALPVWAGISVGVIGGQLDVDLSGFGDFDAALGFQARGELATRFSSGVGVSLWADYRHLAFDYEETVTTGDKEAVGGSVAVGGAVTIRF